MSGFVLMHRDIIANPQFRGKDDIYAAMWLILDSAWEPCNRRVGRVSVSLQRGQTAHAIDFFATAWECSKSTAHARLKHFEKVSFIRTEGRTGYTVVTICNYDKYQAPQSQPERSSARSPNAARTDSKEGKEGKEDSVGVDARALTDESAPAGTDQHDDARTVVASFHQLRSEGWPTEAKFPAPELTLLYQAGTVLADLPLATVLEVMTTETTNAVAAGKSAPQSLKAFGYAFDRASRNLKGGQSHGNRTYARPSDRIDTDDRRRAIAEVCVGGMDTR